MAQTEIEVTPKTTPKIAPTPEVDPDKRLNPDRLCPNQKKEIVRKIRGV